MKYIYLLKDSSLVNFVSSNGGGAISIHTMLYRVGKGRSYRWFLYAQFLMQ